MSIKKKTTLIQSVTEIIKSYLEQVDNQERPVVKFRLPEELKKAFPFQIKKEWITDLEVLEVLQKVLDTSVATQHSLFYNQLYAGADIYWVIAERITAILNTSMYTYEVGPLFTLMEEYIFEKHKALLWRNSIAWMMLPGWSTCNLYAMQFARHHIDKWVRTYGNNGREFVIFTSDQAHYSITKSAMLMGLWTQSIIEVKTNDVWQMVMSDLEEKISYAKDTWKTPMMINATAWTTVSGAYDSIESIVRIGKKYKIWVHVDGIRWWSVILTHGLMSKLKWIEGADSFCWNPHKMLGAPLQCSVFLTNHIDTVETCNTLKAEYLFQDDRGYDSGYDTGDQYVQCGRRVDVLKLWLMRKAYGDIWLAKRITKAFSLSTQLVNKVEVTKQLMVLQQPECTNVCFWYIPIDLYNETISLDTIRLHYDRIHRINAGIKEQLLKEWNTMIWIANLPSKSLPYFFRMIFINPEVTVKDLDFVISEIKRIGRAIEETLH